MISITHEVQEQSKAMLPPLLAVMMLEGSASHMSPVYPKGKPARGQSVLKGAARHATPDSCHCKTREKEPAVKFYSQIRTAQSLQLLRNLRS